MRWAESESGLVGAAAWSAVLAVMVNGALYVAGAAVNAFPADALTPLGRPVTLVSVAVFSAAAPVVGAAIYAVLRGLTRRAWPWFVALATAVVVLMAPAPFRITDAPAAQVVILEIMHLVTAGVTLWRLGRTR